MKLAWILWLASVLPPQAADSLCLSTTLYLEARDQGTEGQQAVAEVALRRRDSGRWGDDICSVVTANKQFAPTLVSPDYMITNVPEADRTFHQLQAVVKMGYLFPELQSMASAAFMALTPGAVDLDIPSLPYQRVQRPIYPLDPDMPEPDLTPVVFDPIGT